MAQQVKALATKPGDVNPIPGTHMMDREKWFLKVVLTSTHVPWWVTYIHVHAHTPTHIINVI